MHPPMIAQIVPNVVMRLGLTSCRTRNAASGSSRRTYPSLMAVHKRFMLEPLEKINSRHDPREVVAERYVRLGVRAGAVGRRRFQRDRCAGRNALHRHLLRSRGLDLAQEGIDAPVGHV